MATWGDNGFERCGIHKLPTDSNRCNKNKICQYPGCSLIPSFGNDAFKAQFCSSHKQDGMWAVCQYRCIIEGCKIPAGYGMQKNKPYYCYQHKTENETYVKKKPQCVSEKCDKIPTFGLPGGDALYCKNHIPQDETIYVDVKHTKCSHKGCNKRPTFGNEFGIALYCAAHKTGEHWDVLNKRCCAEGCSKYPRYGVTRGIASRCIDHTLENDISVFAESIRDRYETVKDTTEFKQMKKEQYVKHKDKILRHCKEYYNQNYLKNLIKRACERANTKKLDFNIDHDLISKLLNEQSISCIYCQCKLQLTGNIGVRQPDIVSIDRVDSDKGYTVNNVQLTCMFCNYAKNRWSDTEYKTFMNCIKNVNNDGFLEDLAYKYKDWRWKHLSRIKRYDKNCSITLEWLDGQLQHQNWKCHYSGLHLIPKPGKPYIFQPSIERLDNSKPHTPDNCVIVCLPLNYGRCSTSLDMFLTHLETIKKGH
jgi:hypothetical protein